ncbi:pyridoxal-phosphate dependent enzyme [Prauserella flavalba]|uniref:Tryptophan synthase beta chain-like PALP domain-containing protein n=1 Tax=Prauserella flavalba TaxID=1477506 RepID=A0A318LJV9_9PSEU|nr:pyridoxal-phosphate dependent enzyme [Prauserella flavalba]PXY28649.1 hypothetical protein BA062_22585 [Prauserella flavalba]
MNQVEPRNQGLNRFAADLPAVDQFVSLGEGNTPLLPLPSLARQLGLARLSAKLESQNPTGSYKDRVAAMSLSLARQRGQNGWIATSSGNAGLSMAAYGTRAGLPGFLCLVASAPLEKRQPLMPYSIGVVAVEGVGRRSKASTDNGLFDHVRSAAERHDLYLAITAHEFNPEGMRGIDTIAYELVEQAPDASHVYVPTGGGGLVTAIGRGLRARRSAAKVIICQPSGCSPIVRHLSREIPSPVIETCESDISALQIPHPPDGVSAVEAVLDSAGWATATGDNAILAAQRRLAETEGVFVEPASAAALACLERDVAEARIGAGAHVVLILTGAGWKDLGRFGAEAAAIDPAELDEVPARVDDWAEASVPGSSCTDFVAR